MIKKLLENLKIQKSKKILAEIVGKKEFNRYKILVEFNSKNEGYGIDDYYEALALFFSENKDNSTINPYYVVKTINGTLEYCTRSGVSIQEYYKQRKKLHSSSI